jgi:hypothetical protein
MLMNSHRPLIAGCLIALAAAARTGAQTPTPVAPINLAAPGTPFSKGVRGLALPSINQFRPQATIGTQTGLAIVSGSSIRGVAGGLEADLYDWRTRNGDARSTTLDYLRVARDHDAKLVITANVRGLTEPDPNGEPGSRRFYDTSIETVSQVAANWVRYTNVIAQKYRQGDAVSDARDQAILKSLKWSTAENDRHDALPAPGEAPLPKVEHWEIGNEPRVSLKNSYRVNNSFTFLSPTRKRDAEHRYDFTERYAAMAAAMKAVDPSVKLGPVLQTAKAAAERQIVRELLKRKPNGKYLPVDFLSYHPYQRLYQSTEPAEIEAGLCNVYNVQREYAGKLRAMVVDSGREANSVALMASEVNVSNWNSNDTPVEAQMGHALGSVETVFAFARLGLTDAHHWLWPASSWDATEYPVYKAYEGLRDHLGDSLLAVYAEGAIRLYATRDSKTREIAIWGLNFSNSADAVLQLELRGLPRSGVRAKLRILKSQTAPTTLFSSNLASHMPGGPTGDVDWVETDVLDLELSDYAMTLPAATISVLAVTPQAPGK